MTAFAPLFVPANGQFAVARRVLEDVERKSPA